MSLRSRKKLKTPKKFGEESTDVSSPAARSHHSTRDEDSSGLEEEPVQLTMPPRKSRPGAKAKQFTGNFARYNPYLPPAPSISVDDTSQVVFPIKYDPSPILWQYLREYPQEAEERRGELNQLAAERGFIHKEFLVGYSQSMGQHRVPSNLDVIGQIAKTGREMSIGLMEKQRASNGQQGQSQRPRTTLEKNMEIIRAAAKMNDLARTMLEMQDSDEELDHKSSAQLMRRRSDEASWDDLPISLQLLVVDEVAHLFDQPELDAIMKVLRLDGYQRATLAGIMRERTDRNKREAQNLRLAKEEIQLRLTIGSRKLTQEIHKKVLDRTLYKTVGEEDYDIGFSKMDVTRAVAYLEACDCGVKPSYWQHLYDYGTSADVPLYHPNRMSKRDPSSNNTSRPHDSKPDPHLHIPNGLSTSARTVVNAHQHPSHMAANGSSQLTLSEFNSPSQPAPSLSQGHQRPLNPKRESASHTPLSVSNPSVVINAPGKEAENGILNGEARLAQPRAKPSKRSKSSPSSQSTNESSKKVKSKTAPIGELDPSGFPLAMIVNPGIPSPYRPHLASYSSISEQNGSANGYLVPPTTDLPALSNGQSKPPAPNMMNASNYSAHIPQSASFQHRSIPNEHSFPPSSTVSAQQEAPTDLTEQSEVVRDPELVRARAAMS